jgi:dTDP-4-amino-4,6-dideoxygalactose transaminase
LKSVRATVVTVLTFFATAGTIVNLGARPIFVDIEETGFEMDPEKLSSFFSQECTFSLTGRRTVHKSTNSVIKAILPVHLYGQCADMDEILAIAQRHNVPVVEDACQAIEPYRIATLERWIWVVSVFPSKNLGGAGDGGMVITSNLSWLNASGCSEPTELARVLPLIAIQQPLMNSRQRS